ATWAALRHLDARRPLRGGVERRTGFTLCQRGKSPIAASNLQFERPWDRFVPAKSVRKLTARAGVSKKFVRAAGYRIRPLLVSSFPRVTKRKIIAMIMSSAIAMPMFNGVIRPGFSGVG